MGIVTIEKETCLSDCRKRLFAFISLSILILLIYSNTFKASWHFDDEQNILKRPSIHLSELSWPQIRGAIFGDSGRLYRPVANLSLALNYYFNQTGVVGYHVLNTAVHIVTAFFLFLFLYRVLQFPRLRDRYGDQAYFIAMLGSVLWAVNPVQTQAVTYIIQRMASLAGMFYILSLYFYLMGRQPGIRPPGRWVYFAGCVVFGIGAIGSKENAVTLPFAILLLDLLIIQGVSGKTVKRAALLLFGICALAVGFALLYKGTAVFDPDRFFAVYKLRNFTMMERLLTEQRVLLFYLSLLFYPIPARLSLFHEISVSQGLFEPISTLFSVLAVLLLIIGAVLLSKKRPLIAFCVLFFFLNHGVESSIIPLELIFEHRNYIPSLFLFVLVAILFVRVLHRMSYSRNLQRLIVAFVIFFIVLQGQGTFLRNTVWRTDESLWLDVLDKYPRSQRAHHGLGYYYSRKGLLARAIEEYEITLRLPGDSYGNKLYITHTNLGTLYIKLNRLDKALHHFQEALDIAPGFYWPTYNNCGATYIMQKEFQKAIGILTKALTFDRDNWELHHNLGIALLRSNNHPGALSEFRYAYRLNRDALSTLEYLGVTHKKLGEWGEAAGYFKQVLKRKPRAFLARLHLAETYALAGKAAHARRYVFEALAGTPPAVAAAELSTDEEVGNFRERPSRQIILRLAEEYYRDVINSVRSSEPK